MWCSHLHAKLFAGDITILVVCLPVYASGIGCVRNQWWQAVRSGTELGQVWPAALAHRTQWVAGESIGEKRAAGTHTGRRCNTLPHFVTLCNTS